MICRTRLTNTICMAERMAKAAMIGSRYWNGLEPIAGRFDLDSKDSAAGTIWVVEGGGPGEEAMVDSLLKNVARVADRYRDKEEERWTLIRGAPAADFKRFIRGIKIFLV